MSFEHNRQLVTEQLRALRPEMVSPMSDFGLSPIHTIIAKPPEHITARIMDVVSNLAHDHPEHYYYRPEQLHVTLLALGGLCEKLPDLSPWHEMLDSKKLKVRALGMGANKFSGAIPVYPAQENVLVSLREDLRRLTGATADYSEHASVWERIMWINFMRFTSTPSPALFDRLQQLTETDFGSYTIDEWQLYKTTSRVLAPNESAQQASFS